MPDSMWSPWRSEYVGGQAQEKAGQDRPVFAALAAADPADDAQNLILWRGEHVFVVMNRYPYNNGHLLIVPFREVARYETLRSEEQVALARTIDRCIRWVTRALQPDGFNVGMNLGAASGAGIPQHLHLHIVPRWSGDTNFMSTTADLRVIPEAMHATYEKLRAAVEDARAAPAADTP